MKGTLHVTVRLTVLMGALAVSGLDPLSGQPATPNPARDETLRRYEAARANPTDKAAFDAFLATLPKVDEYYLLEGDLRMTEEEILEYLIAIGSIKARDAIVSPELVVNLYRGQADFYPPERRTLTYFIDRATFRNDAEFTRVAQDMAAAIADWEHACPPCGVRFVRMKERIPGSPPNFIVRTLNANGDFIAAAFFPHDVPARRTLDIDPSYFTTRFRPVGVLRHELGHVLGYRHEQVRGVRGCFREDRFWRPLTVYDPKSVMHYFCGGAGTLELTLTHIDREGHRSLYEPTVTAAPPSAPPGASTAGLPAAPSPSPAATQTSGRPSAMSDVQSVLVVSLEGGEVSDNAAAVLSVLHGLKVLPVENHTVAKGDNIESVFRDHLGLPFHSEAMTRFAGELNGNKNFLTRALTIDEKITIPNVRFMERTYGIRDDRQRIQGIEKNWDYLISKDEQAQQAQQTQQKGSPQQIVDQNSVRIEVKRYELRLRISDEKALMAAVSRIHAIPTKNIIAGIERVPVSAAKYFGVPAALLDEQTYSSLDQFVQNRDHLKAGDQARILSLLDDAIRPGVRACTENCADVILVDKKVSLHPDLKDAVTGDDLDDAALNTSLVTIDGRQTVEVVDWQEGFHATHLAGIIAARDNKFGLVGVDPNAAITSWNWDVLRSQPFRVADDVSDRQAEGQRKSRLQIYTFATEWRAPVGVTRETRISQDVLAKRLVQDESPLVIVAAGQASTAAAATEITMTTSSAPVNLGDQDNVLVVTACTTCKGPNAQILPEAHYSKEFVHVAAPGANVLSTAPGAKYSRGQGTSQAAAFTAGLASLMVGRFPGYYGNDAYRVKVRLMVTSTPFELIGTLLPGRSVTTGIVSPMLAAFDPSKHWLKRNGVDWADVSKQEHARKFTWAADVLNVVHSDGRRELVPLQDVWRLARDGDRWMAYLGERRGKIRKIGPVRVAASEGNKVLFRVAGEEIKPSMFEDLILSYPSSGR
jgi:subtilase family protein